MLPIQPLSPAPSVGEPSSSLPDAWEPLNSQQQCDLDKAVSAAPDDTSHSADLHRRGLRKVAAMERQARACQDTPPELLQLIQVSLPLF